MQIELMHLAGAAWMSQCVHVAARLGVADLLKDGPRTTGEIAAAAGCQPGPLLRILRVLCAIGVFQRAGDDSFQNSPGSERLRTDHPSSLRHYCMLSGAEYYEAWGQLLHATRTGESGFSHLHGCSLYDYMDRHPETAEVYDEAMVDLTRGEAAEIARSHDFTEVRLAIDIGGGRGIVLRKILAAYPEMRGVCVDRADVCRRATEALSRSAEHEILRRLEFTPGDFFESVPTGGDVYIVKNVLHNWNERSCVRILKTVREAMLASSGSPRLLVIEHLVERDDESLDKLMDAVLQIAVCEEGTRERTEQEMRTIVSQAGLTTTNVRRIAGGHSLIEATVARATVAACG